MTFYMYYLFIYINTHNSFLINKIISVNHIDLNIAFFNVTINQRHLSVSVNLVSSADAYIRLYQYLVIYLISPLLMGISFYFYICTLYTYESMSED